MIRTHVTAWWRTITLITLILLNLRWLHNKSNWDHIRTVKCADDNNTHKQRDRPCVIATGDSSVHHQQRRTMCANK